MKEGSIDKLKYSVAPRSCAKMVEMYNLSFQNLCYHVDAVPFVSKERKQILKNINGEFFGSELTAIVGFSGSGKSSLLDCLSGYRQTNISGSIKLNGISVSTNIIKQISSYVMQEQTLHVLLTLNEIMNLSMNLRDKQNLSVTEKENKMQSIFEKLSIGGLSDMYIRDMSGGERKRVQIAVELVTDPKILFLDECTTGLDSVASIQCIHMLQMLAKDFRTIICTIHQPSATMLEMFDNVFALADGSCIYQGSNSKLVGFLQELDLPCPETYNPSDFLLEVANNDYGDYINRLIERIENGRSTKFRNNLTFNNNTNHTESLKMLKTDSSSQPTKYQTSYFRQVHCLMRRLFLITSRDRSLFCIRLLVHVLLGVVFGVIYKDVGNKATAMLDNYRFLVISVVFLLYTSYHSLFIAFPLEFPIIKREHFNGWYSTRAYYSAFILFDLPITLLCCLSYISITYWMTDQPRELNRFLLFVAFGLFMSYAAQSLGIMITSLMSLKVATILGTFFLTPFFLFSGVMITTKDANAFFNFFFNGNFLDCGLKGVLNSVFGFNRKKLECDEIYCHFGDPKKVLKDFGAEVNMCYAFSIIVFYIFFCQIVSFVLFRYRLKHRLA